MSAALLVIPAPGSSSSHGAFWCSAVHAIKTGGKASSCDLPAFGHGDRRVDMSFVSFTLPCELSAPHPGFAENFLEAAAPPQPIVRAVPFDPGKSGPKTLIFKAAQGSVGIRFFLQRPKPDAEEVAKNEEERRDEEKLEAQERPNRQVEEVRRISEAAVSIDTTASIDTSKAKTAGFRGSQGSNLCPGVNCEAHSVRTRRDYRAPDVCA